MTSRKRQDEPRGIFQELNPMLPLGAVAVSIVLWSFRTFAQLDYVREQNQALSKQIDENQKIAIQHSDENRQRMEALMAEIRDTVKLIEQRTYRSESGHH